VTPGACQTAGSGDTACFVPWTDDARADAKMRLLEFVARTPDGANLPYIVRTIFEQDTDMAGSDAQLARRFFESYPELFKTTQRDSYAWVYPRRAAFHLNRRMHRAKTVGGGGATRNAAETSPDFVKDQARAMLSKVSELGSDSLRADMLGELASVADTWNVLEWVPGSGPEYLCLLYRNRLNSPSWASTFRRRGGVRGDARGVSTTTRCWTLTTDPKRHDSIADATDSLIENKNRLSSWLACDPESGSPRPGFRPSNLYALEFTDSGIPCLHVVYFGVQWSLLWRIAESPDNETIND